MILTLESYFCVKIEFLQQIAMISEMKYRQMKHVSFYNAVVLNLL